MKTFDKSAFFQKCCLFVATPTFGQKTHKHKRLLPAIDPGLNILNKIFLIPVLVCFSLIAFSQTESINKTHSKGKVYLNDQRIIYVKNLKVNDNELNFQYKENSTHGSLDINDVKQIKVTKGSYAGRGALIGGGTMALSSLYTLARINNDPYLETNGNVGGIIVGMIAGGAIVGALIGTAFPKWKTIHPNNNKTVGSNQIKYRVDLLANSNFIGLKLKLSRN